MKWKHGLGNKTRHMKISVHIQCSLHLLEDDIRDRSMQTFHVVCHVAHSGSRLAAGRIGKRNFLHLATSSLTKKRKKYGILRKGKLIEKT